MIPNPASTSSTAFQDLFAAPAHHGPAPATGGFRPNVHSREDHPASSAAWDEDWSDTLSWQDAAALDALSFQFHQLDAPDSGNLAAIVRLFTSLKEIAPVIEHALKWTPDAAQLSRLRRALVRFLRQFKHALVDQPGLRSDLDIEAIRSLCHGLSVCASPGAGSIFDPQQAHRVKAALQGMTDILLERLADLGMPEAASANGVVLDILNWVSRGLKSKLLSPSALMRESYRQALELFAAWLGSDHTRGFLSVHQLAKCAVQVDLMVKRELVALEVDAPQGKVNRALLAQCGMGLCSPAALDRLDTGSGVDGVPLINLCNAVRTLLDARVLRADDSALTAPLSQLLGLVLRLTLPQLCGGNGQTLSNCGNFVRTLFEAGIHAQGAFAPALPALEKASAHLIAAVNHGLGEAGSQAISNLISFVKLCDKRLQQQANANDAHSHMPGQADLIRAAGILQSRLMMHEVAAFNSAEAVGGLLSGLCYLWRRGLVMPSGAEREWIDALMRSMAGMDAAQWSDKSRKVMLPALQALMEMDITTLEAAQPALGVLLRGPASASSGHTRADLAQAIKALGAIEEAVPALPPDLTAQAASAPARAPAAPAELPRAIPGLTRLVAPAPVASPLTRSSITPGASAPRWSSAKTAEAQWRTPARAARKVPLHAPVPDLAVNPASTPSWPDATTTAATTTATTTRIEPAQKGSPAKHKPAASGGKSKPLKPAQQWFALLKGKGDSDPERLDELARSQPGLVNKKDESGRNALFHAIAGGNARAVAWLIAHEDYVAPAHTAQFLDGLLAETLLYSAAFGAALECFLEAQPAAVKDELRAYFARKPPMMNGLAAVLERCGLAASEQAGADYLRGTGRPDQDKPGKATGTDVRKLFEQYRKAAMQGDAGAQYELAECYRHGTGVKKDEKAAVGWYRKAAEQGHAAAQNNLGVCYGQGTGVEKDEKAAVGWFRKAAEQGNAGAQATLGLWYQYGTGVEKDEKAAVGWYRKAAEQGNASAQHNLGFCYDQGTGVAKDEKAAVAWYRKAADQGNAAAQNNLGVCYGQGTGVEKDEKAAVGWFRKAAEQGDAGAQNSLGFCYDQGIGVEKDEKAAVAWYRKAADQGNADAQNSVGYCYQHGTGVEKDEKAAVVWFRKAAAQGHAGARVELARLLDKPSGAAKNV